MKKHFIVIYRPGARWIAEAPIWEQPLQAHANYMHQLHQQGILQQGGPFTDSMGGAAVIAVNDEQEAQEILLHDPAVTSDILIGELHPWHLVDWLNYGAADKTA